jgi:hypothetical protein
MRPRIADAVGGMDTPEVLADPTRAGAQAELFDHIEVF